MRGWAAANVSQGAHVPAVHLITSFWSCGGGQEIVVSFAAVGVGAACADAPMLNRDRHTSSKKDFQTVGFFKEITPFFDTEH